MVQRVLIMNEAWSIKDSSACSNMITQSCQHSSNIILFKEIVFVLIAWYIIYRLVHYFLSELVVVIIACPAVYIQI